jgi:hypothetical protein
MPKLLRIYPTSSSVIEFRNWQPNRSCSSSDTGSFADNSLLVFRSKAIAFSSTVLAHHLNVLAGHLIGLQTIRSALPTTQHLSFVARIAK